MQLRETVADEDGCWLVSDASEAVTPRPVKVAGYFCYWCGARGVVSADIKHEAECPTLNLDPRTLIGSKP